MAMYVRTIQGERCDKCKSSEGDLLQIQTSGRHHDDRNLIFVHERCLQKAIEKMKKELIAGVA